MVCRSGLLGLCLLVLFSPIVTVFPRYILHVHIYINIYSDWQRRIWACVRMKEWREGVSREGVCGAHLVSVGMEKCGDENGRTCFNSVCAEENGETRLYVMV